MNIFTETKTISVICDASNMNKKLLTICKEIKINSLENIFIMK